MFTSCTREDASKGDINGVLRKSAEAVRTSNVHTLLYGLRSRPITARLFSHARHAAVVLTTPAIHDNFNAVKCMRY